MRGRSATWLVDDPRAVTVAAVALVSAGLWLALWLGMGGMAMEMAPRAMPGMGGGTMPETTGMGSADVMAPMQPMASGPSAAVPMPGMEMTFGWSAGLVASTAAMWLLMMAAMMLPAMAPMLAVYAGLAAKEDRGAALALRVGLFALGYFLLWSLFSVAAAVGQLGLRDSAYFTMGGTLATPAAAGILLLIAGGWQFTPVKDLCVRHCRHPLHYLMQHWREGTRGAFAVGARHGIYCFGCCFAFMGLMFVFGTMNVLWMAAIAAYFLAEKVLPRQRLWGRATGALLMAAGAVMLARGLI